MARLTRRLLRTGIGLALLGGASLGQNKPAAVAKGAYECWANGEARLLLNFTIVNASSYKDSESKPGAYSYDAQTGKLTFKGGMLDGAMPTGFEAIYHEPRGKPTVSFRSARGSEAAFCEKAGK